MDKFVDDIGVIRVGSGLVRIQTTRRIEDAQGEQRIQERGDVVMPITTFLKMHADFNKAIEEMLEKGLLKRKDDVIEKTEEAESSEPSELNNKKRR